MFGRWLTSNALLVLFFYFSVSVCESPLFFQFYSARFIFHRAELQNQFIVVQFFILLVFSVRFQENETQYKKKPLHKPELFETDQSTEMNYELRTENVDKNFIRKKKLYFY